MSILARFNPEIRRHLLFPLYGVDISAPPDLVEKQITKLLVGDVGGFPNTGGAANTMSAIGADTQRDWAALLFGSRTRCFHRSSRALRRVLSGATFLFLWSVLGTWTAGLAHGQAQTDVAAKSTPTFSAADIGTGTRPISGLWQFHLGDDPAWAQPNFDDRGWERLPADKSWGAAGHPGYWGYAWYRRVIALDPNSKEPLALLLPPLDSVAEVYWNGVKIGGEGTMPPNPSWFNIPQPVAIPLPPATGAGSGVLAIRTWAAYRDATDSPDASGLQGSILLGYSPLIQKMPDAWGEHKLRVRMVANLGNFLSLITSVVALVLWSRFRSQWVLIWVGLYFGSYVIIGVSIYQAYSLPWEVANPIGFASSMLTRISVMGLILFVADLPSRPGVKGFRFWASACLAVSAAAVFYFVLAMWHDSTFVLHHFTQSQPLSSVETGLLEIDQPLNSFFDEGYSFFVLTLLTVCLILSRRTLPRVLFMVAAALDLTIQLAGIVSKDATSRLVWFRPIMSRPVLQIYGSNLTLATTTRMLVLAAVVYAVWDQLGRQLAQQRFANAELKAAQEIQQVLVPATAERSAPGFDVSSVYRPASEVGGDFFQIISLEANGAGDGTLIVAGDVSGKGLRAAMTVSLVVGALRTLAEYDPEPAAVLAGLNRRLIGRTQGGFVTCCVVRIDAAGRATMANAGHCQPYLDGREVELPNSLPLGIVEDAEYEEIALNVSHGQQLTMLSDGVVEARNHHGELYGFDRLTELMRQRPTAEQVAETAIRFGQDDDITVLTVTRLMAIATEPTVTHT